MSNSLKGLIQKTAGQSVNLHIGTVVSANPLSVKLHGDSNLTISSGLLTVPKSMSKRTVGITVVIDGVSQNTTATIDDSIKKGDDLIILGVGRGSSYLVIGRC